MRRLILAAALALFAGPALAASQVPVIQTAGGYQEATPVYPVPPKGPITAASGNVANASAVATLAAAALKTTFISGFQCTAAGSTGALVVNLTLVGVITGTMTYTFTFPAGATVAAAPVREQFSPPIPASAVNTAIVVTLPAGGAGNTNAACNATGFQQ